MSVSVLEMGRRLTELRKVLSRDSGQEWTRAGIAQESGLTQSVIHRLEGGSGSIENLLILLHFYHIKGYNTQWVITLDNSSVRMYRADKSSDQELIQTLEKLNTIIKTKFS
jgi:DNA-directed RNA polymerase specialized sigma subunit